MTEKSMRCRSYGLHTADVWQSEVSYW